jgi:hypothetical protein
MHQAGVFLLFLLFAWHAVAVRRRMLLLLSRAIELSCPWLDDRRKRQCASESKNVSIHQTSVVAAVSAASSVRMQGGTLAATVVGSVAGPTGHRSAMPYSRQGGACAGRLRCRINSANENACNGGPVSSDNVAIACSEHARNAPVSAEKFVSLNFASSRAQAFDCAKTIARRTLQHWTWEDCSFCFAGLEWNGHSV